jgi:hypothetical protein
MYRYLTLAATVIVLGLSGCKKNDYTVYALTSNNQVLSFNAGKPDKIISDVTLSGLSDGSSLVQIFYRPSSQVLYCVTTDNELCTLDPDSGAVTLIDSGTTFLPSDLPNTGTNATLTDVVASIDPINDQVRVIGKSSQSDDANFLVDPDTGQPAAANPNNEEALKFAGGDVNDVDNQVPTLMALAYDPPLADAGSTTLYGLDQTTQSLVRVGDDGAGSGTNTASPSNGEVHTIGALSTKFSNNYAALAIEAKNGDAYAVLATSTSSLYSIDLGSGSLSLLNTIGDGTWTVISMAIKPDV